MTSQYNSSTLPVWRYDSNSNQWKSYDPSRSQDTQPKDISSFRVVTYNIWFDQSHQPFRFQSLSVILNNSNSHVICLQEMTYPILQQLISQSWVQQRYMISDVDASTFSNGKQGYGVVMLIQKDLCLRQLLIVEFPTRMGRSLLFTQLKFGTETILVGTVHLESLNSREARSQQLKICKSIFETYTADDQHTTCLLMGDFNFDANGSENVEHMTLLSNWLDVWPTVKGPNNLGWTFDTSTNTMLKNHPKTTSRLDRIMIASSVRKPAQIEIIGNKCVEQMQLETATMNNRTTSLSNIFPSDHYGLMADFN
ncbi:unnamed protein product [Didymodactylos carnosus]|uniref:Endonuclease/exonuclease/phosphatase domain-containing protein n=1 Tax=Didymodactylos carnosus TaxID=1234261 RepID=A0A813Q414_9BILA|nr:unnamed protein product [Didymodactylos carnosus]CAF0846817.1 unnamed protein product [Didymodactylos carnosus]CAF3542593.1 unnamed protein product [Didymodactylos carnosus]CAF3631956.1 unnamed protein product [Didymodactylos carnosus]